MSTKDMTEREQLIEDFIPKLKEAMLEKARKNNYKKPLSALSGGALRAGREDEAEELELELTWVKRFDKDPVAALLELADYCIYAAEDLRRIKAI